MIHSHMWESVFVEDCSRMFISAAPRATALEFFHPHPGREGIALTQVDAGPAGRWGALRLLVWVVLLGLAFPLNAVAPPSWPGLVGLGGAPVLLAGLGVFWAAVGVRGYAERKRHDAALESIPIRIHVDGSRGKTGTSRLIGEALRANGIRVLVKTTGKIPCLIDTAGKETVLERGRTGAPNLREQRDVVRLAAEQGAQAIVVECMAVDPELRRVSEQTLIRATIAVLTNVRRDHLEVIGPDLGTAARSLCEVIPRNGTLVTGERRLLPVLEEEAAKRNARVVCVDPETVSDAVLASVPYITFKENVAIALAVSDHLKLDRQRSIEGIRASTPDYGTVRLFDRQAKDGLYTLVCALGVNDVDSLLSLRAELVRRGKMNGGPLVGLFNSRDDRATRSVEFAKGMARDLDFRSVLVTGRHTKAFVHAAVKNGYPRERLSEMERASPHEILDALDGLTPAGGTVFACGNMVTGRGYGLVDALVQGETHDHAGN